MASAPNLIGIGVDMHQPNQKGKDIFHDVGKSKSFLLLHVNNEGGCHICCWMNLRTMKEANLRARLTTEKGKAELANHRKNKPYLSYDHFPIQE
jgi:hypothetical protein